MEEKKEKKASKRKKNSENKRTLLFEKAKELKIPNYQKLSNDDLEKEIEKVENNASKKEDDISLLSKIELISIAKDLKIKNYSKLKKDELIGEINKARNSKNNEDNNNKEQEIKQEKSNLKEIPNNLNDLTRNELIEFCKIYRIKNYSKVSKSKIIKILNDIKNKKNNNKLEENSTSNFETLVNKKNNIIYEKKKNTELVNKEDNKVPEKEEKIKPLEKEEKKVVVSSDKKKIKKENKKLNEEKEIKEKEQKVEDEVKQNAKHFQDDVKTKILFMPSKYGFGKTNEEFILEDEKEINLKPSIIDSKDEITLLPIDPYKAYVYWTLSPETIKKLNKLKIRELILKLNDVTGIIYNGNNANSFWFEKTLLNSPNWYINLPKNNFNLCIELGYVIGNTFFIIEKSNVVHIPTANPSPIIDDKFVIVNMELEKKEKISNKYYLPKQETLKKEVKLPKITKIPKHFIKEYEIKQEKPLLSFSNKNENINIALPPKLPKVNLEFININKQEKVFNKKEGQINYKNKPTLKFDISNKEKAKNKEYFNFNKKNKENKTNTFVIHKENNYITNKNIQSKRDNNDNIINDTKDKETFYYQIPKDSKVVKIYYSSSQSKPYERVFYYIIEPKKIIHEKLYKISYGPSWIKEFIGGSERIKFLGASERFLGASDIFMGASERFIGGSDIFLGGSEKFLGASDLFLGASEKYYSNRKRFYRFSEPINIKIDNFVNEIN